jgi:hypothetical protein
MKHARGDQFPIAKALRAPRARRKGAAGQRSGVLRRRAQYLHDLAGGVRKAIAASRCGRRRVSLLAHAFGPAGNCF